MLQKMMGFWGGIGKAGQHENNLHLAPDKKTMPTCHHSIFMGWMLFLTCQSNEGNNCLCTMQYNISKHKQHWHTFTSLDGRSV